MRVVEEVKKSANGILLILNEDGKIHEEFVSENRIRDDGTILIFADKVSDDDADNWFPMDLNKWLSGMGSVL